MGDRRGGELNSDQTALIIAAVVVVTILFARRHQILATMGGWLRSHQLLATEPGGLAIPQLGWLDAPRLMIIAGSVVIMIVLARALGRGRLRRRSDGRR